MKPSAKKLCLNRVVFSSLWNLALQSFMIAVFLLIINVNLLHPVTSIKNWIGCIFNWRTWLYIFPLIIVVCAQSFVCCREYITVEPFYQTRFSIFIQILSPDHLIILFLHLIIGYLISWIYLSLSGTYLKSFTLMTPIPRLNEERIFLIFGSVWVNFVYFLRNHFGGVKHMMFPVLQQPKYDQIKFELVTSFKSSVPEVFLPNCLYLVLYYFRGSYIRSISVQLLDLHPLDHVMDSMSGLLNVKILICLWCLSILVISTMKLMEFLFRVYLTERQVFPFYSSLADPDLLTLNDAIKSEEFPFLKHLGYLDLFMLSQNSLERRSHIYKLSQPGGHPHVWNALRDGCFTTIETFIASLTSLLIFRQTKEKPVETFNRFGVPIPSDHPVKLEPYKTTVFEIITTKIAIIYSDIKHTISSKISWWFNLPIIVYLFGDRKDLKIKFALKQAQPVIWACHSLSYLAAYSLTEDEYGIIQNDLAKIICLLLKLKQTLESVDKHIAVDCSKNSNLSKSKTLTAFGLTKSVNRSIYRISDSFRTYIQDLQLPRDVEIQMVSFADYKV